MFFKAYELPEMVGLPIGGNVGDFFYRLEVHYNNPNKIAGQSVVLYNVKYHTVMNKVSMKQKM